MFNPKFSSESASSISDCSTNVCPHHQVGMGLKGIHICYFPHIICLVLCKFNGTLLENVFDRFPYRCDDWSGTIPADLHEYVGLRAKHQLDVLSQIPITCSQLNAIYNS